MSSRSHQIQKGFSRKLGKISKKSHFFWIFCRKLGFFWIFFVKEGGGLAQSKIFLNRKILGVQIDGGGGGGSRSFGQCPKKNSFSYLIAPLTWPVHCLSQVPQLDSIVVSPFTNRIWDGQACLSPTASSKWVGEPDYHCLFLLSLPSLQHLEYSQ